MSALAADDPPGTNRADSSIETVTEIAQQQQPVTGKLTYTDIDGRTYQRVFDQLLALGLMLDTITCKNDGATYDTTWVPAKGFWMTHHGMSADDYAERNRFYTPRGYKQTWVYTCGTVMVAIWRKP
jgi:hypothetical protein